MKTNKESSINNCKNYIIDPKNFKIISRIQSGGFSSVYRVQEKSTSNILAAKIIQLDLSNQKNKEMINQEISIMIECRHPTIIDIYGYSFQDLLGQNNVTIFMELAENGSLENLLQNVQNGFADHAYDNTIRQIILIGIARGMVHLHKHNVFHCDLKPGNILLDSNFHPQITDFGLSKIFSKSSSIRASNQVGTYTYMAPELLSENKISEKTDVYSFAILMYEVITDSIPYPLFVNQKMSLSELTRKIVVENYRPQFTFPVKKSLKELIEQCWSKDPKKRPTFDVIFKKLAYNDQENLDYFLDDVDVEEIRSYVDSIQKVDDSENLIVLIEKLKRENQELKSKLDNIAEKEILPLKKENQKLKKENKQMKTQLNEIFEKQVNPLKKHNEYLKKRINMFEKQLNINDSNVSGALFDASNPVDVFISPNFISNEIMTFKDFNSSSLESQQFFISKLVSNKSRNEPILTKINNFLVYLSKFVKKASFSFFKISKNDANDDDDEIMIDEKIQICLLSKTTEVLFLNKVLQSTEFVNLMKQFQNLSIEMTYPSINFNQIYQIISAHKTNISFEITIIITNISELDNSLSGKKDISNIIIDSSIKKIKREAFFKCSSLKQIIIPSTIQLIDEYSFQDCSSLQRINLPSSINEISASLFCNSALVEIEIPSSVTRINEHAFDECFSLKKVIIPPSVTIIDDCAFNKCKLLCQISLPPNLNLLGESCFYCCFSLTEITIPPLINQIYFSTFENCTSLSKVTFENPSHLATIDDQAFSDCPSLNQITLPPSVKDISKNAFSPNTKVIKPHKKRK